MPNSIFFATFDPLRNAPCVCSLCASSLAAFNYEVHTEDGSGSQYGQGACCASCAATLLERLKGQGSQEWSEEEATLKAADLVGI